MNNDEKLTQYSAEIKSFLPISLDDLIVSHRRQREIVSEYTDRHLKSNARLWFLPFRLRLWIQGN